MSKLDNIKKNLKGETSDFFKKYNEFLKKYQNLGVRQESDSITSVSLKSKNTPKFEELLQDILSNSTEVDYSDKTYSRSMVYSDIKFFIEYFKNKKIERVEYGLIYRIVLSVKHEVNYPREEDSDLGNLNYFLQLVKELLLRFIDSCERNGKIQEYEKYIICFYKVVEHTILANMQYEELYLNSEKQMENLNETIKYVSESVDELFSEANTKISDINYQTNDIKRNTSKIEKRLANFNTEVISILGVFSAFVFVMFGGFDSLAKILGGLQDNDVSIRKILLISSILISFLITILYSLMYWVSIIIEKPILQKNCQCENVCWDLKHLYERHRFYLTLMIVCAILFTISLLFIKN